MIVDWLILKIGWLVACRLACLWSLWSPPAFLSQALPMMIDRSRLYFILPENSPHIWSSPHLLHIVAQLPKAPLWQTNSKFKMEQMRFARSILWATQQTCNWVPPPSPQKLDLLHLPIWRRFPIWVCGQHQYWKSSNYGWIMLGCQRLPGHGGWHRGSSSLPVRGF